MLYSTTRYFSKDVNLTLGMFIFGLLSSGCAVDVDLDINGRQLLGDGIPNDFVEISSVIPDVTLDVRYFSAENFVGEPVKGYQAETLLLTEEAATALSGVQAELNSFGLGLKIFDAYRPQQAVDHFVRWAEDTADTRMKSQYYPNVDKKNLFRDGYIADRSGHSRGSTVDVTLIDLATGEELDMGAGWDFFDPISWPASDLVNREQKNNRLLLRSLMIAHGFLPLAQEWWHFTLQEEPYPDEYFDFPVLSR